MSNRKHVDIAARHTFDILSYGIALRPLSDADLLGFVDAVYVASEFSLEGRPRNRCPENSKDVTFDGVRLAYKRFYGQRPCLWDIRKFLIDECEHKDWTATGS